MTVVVTPAPARECPKCGALPGVYCWNMTAVHPLEHLKGNRSHAERHPARIPTPGTPVRGPRIAPSELDVTCPLCGATRGQPCRRIFREVGRLVDGTDSVEYAKGTGPPTARPHLGRRLRAKG